MGAHQGISTAAIANQFLTVLHAPTAPARVPQDIFRATAHQGRANVSQPTWFDPAAATSAETTFTRGVQHTVRTMHDGAAPGPRTMANTSQPLQNAPTQDELQKAAVILMVPRVTGLQMDSSI